MARWHGFLSFVLVVGCSRAPKVTTFAPTPPAAIAAPAPAEGAEPAGSVAAAGFPGHHHDVAEAELVHFSGTRGTLGGFLYRPQGAGPFPAVIYNHGSEALPGNKFGQALFYVKRGYVLFVPHRLGQGQSPGQYIMDAVQGVPAEARAAKLVSVLEEQVNDVADASVYLESLSFVNRRAVAMVGCSFGGIETLFAAERDLGLRAAVDFSGAAMTWSDNQALRERMDAAARNAKVPVFFLQAENDYDTAPSLELSRAMDDTPKPHLLRIFPPSGRTHEEGHAFCHGGIDPAWGNDVLTFLAKSGVAAPSPIAPHMP